MIIGIGHKMRQGKDTIANYLVEKYSFKKIAFADILKDEVSDPSVPVLFYYKTTGLLVMTDKYGGRFEIGRNAGFSNIYDKFVSYLEKNNDYDSINVIIKNGVVNKDRQLYQLWGDYRRTVFGKDYFVDKVISVIDNSDDDYVISDVRFLNEANAIRKMGGVLLKVYGRLVNEAHTDHISENELNDFRFDYEISNDTTFDDLYYNVDLVMRDILSE